MSLDERAQHVVDVDMTITGAAGQTELWMPVWTPGAYELRTWGRNVTITSVRDDADHDEPFARRGPSSFVVDGGGGGALHVHYRVYAPKLTDDGTHIDGDHALLNGSSLFLAVDHQYRALHQVRVVLPRGWRAVTALDEDGEGWSATSYEQLIDAPIECSRFADATARAAGRSYRIVVDGANAVPARLVADVARIAEAEAHLAGPPPYRRYVMLVHLSDEADRVAALEHAASTSIIVPRKSLSDANAYDELTYVVAHELFHAWNAKLLRPAELWHSDVSPSSAQYDLTQAQPARSLWITEGLTEYFAHRAMLRAGRWSRAAYLSHVGDEAARAVEAARHGLSIEQAAEMTWQPPDDGADDSDAYYARGHLIALALDATLRVRSDGKHGLDELIHAAVAQAERGHAIMPVSTRWLAERVDALVPAVGLGATLERWVAVPDESSEVRAALAAIGLALDCARRTAVVLGLAAERDGAALRVLAVGEGGPADLAGIKPGDRIVSLDGAPPPPRWPERIAHGAAGDKVLLGVTRAQRTLELHLTLESEADTSCKLTQAPATPAVTRLRDQLLSP